MKWPFHHFDADAGYLERARAIAPDDWSAWAKPGHRLGAGGTRGRGAGRRSSAPRRFAARRSTPAIAARPPYLREALAILSGELAEFAPQRVP